MTLTLDPTSDPPSHDLDARAASAFLQSQARWLAHALEHVESTEVVDTVLGMHDASHDRWLGLIAGVERTDGDAAADLTAVYGYHGRVAGSLERGVAEPLGGGVRRRVCTLLARRLDQLTDEAVAIVEDLAAR